VFAIGIDAVVASGLLPGITSSLVISSGHAGQRSPYRHELRPVIADRTATPGPGLRLREPR
jgi:hypothetical protein